MLNGETAPYFFVLQVDPLDDDGEPSSMMVDDDQKGGIWYSSRLKGLGERFPE
jgi:hypothetical protein